MFRNKRSKDRQQPEISTASLPDIVFILLFFFMVATVMRNEVLIVKNELPEADVTEKLEKRDLLMNIYVGQPSSRYKTQINDKLANINEIRPFVFVERAKKDGRLQPFLITALKVDKGTKMGLVSDIKKELQKADALKVNFTTKLNKTLADNNQ